MSNDVTIKMDSRLLYGLIALVAVVGIFAIGLWLGGAIGGDEEAAGTASSSNAPVTQADPNAMPTLVISTDPNNPAPGAAPVDPAAVGAAPVSVDEVPAEEGQPRIWIPEAAESNWQYDLGSIPADQPVEKDFIVENTGLGVLEITDASASCGCTAALVEDSTVEPGAATTIRVSYDPRVNQEFGKFVTKQIRVKSNDPLVPLAEFTITADVQPQ